LPVLFCGATSRMHPPSMSHVNNIRLETFVCFLNIA
jgi:hypothetical protein